MDEHQPFPHEHEAHPQHETHIHPHSHEEHHKHDSNTSHKIAASILVGSLLVSASVLYGSYMLVKSGSAVQVKYSGDTATVGQQVAPLGDTAPAGPVNVTARSNQPVLGNRMAKVTIYEFGDFQCPFCQNFFNNTFEQIKKEYIDTGKVQYVFRHFPLSFHAQAEAASVAAECANEQNEFWDYHDLLYKNGKGDGTGLSTADLKKYADDMGLNQGLFGFGNNKFNECLDGNKTLQIVKDDMAEGTKDGVSGTPTFFINGEKIVGAQPYATIKAAIDKALLK